MMCASVIKTLDGKYKAVLSDDSLDREFEVVGKSFLEGALNDKVFGLLNHNAAVENRVCDWVNKKLEVVKGHNALTAEPQFFLSNPKAALVKGMLDDGAELGVSIGAMPTKSDKVKIEGKEYKRYTEGKILEASFVGIPANANAGAVNTDFLNNSYNLNLAIAKELKLDFKEVPMSENKEMAEKATNMIDVLKETEANVTKEVIDNMEKVLVAAGIEKEVYEKLLPEISKPHPPEKKPGKKPNDDDDDNRDDKKSLDADEINKLIETGVEKKLKETPIFKAQMDSMDMTPKELADKSIEIQEKGLIPILRT